MCADFFELWSVQSAIEARRGHSLNTGAPMLSQSQFLKDSTQDAVAKFGNTFLDVVNGKPEREQAGVFNFQAVVK